MSEFGYPILYALFVWWFSTSAVLYLDGLPRKTFRWTLLASTALLCLALWAVAETRAQTTVASAYLAFTSGLLIWGWLEVSLYTGFITGPRKQGAPKAARGARRFVLALQTILYHELAAVAFAGLLVWLCWGQPNSLGMWTFIVLWWMHQSAKLNMFLGVRNHYEEFLPDHLRYMQSFFTKKAMNPLFPFSITVSTAILVILAYYAAAADVSRFDSVGFIFLATLVALAVLEHWFLVLPIPTEMLWRWGLKSRSQDGGCPSDGSEQATDPKSSGLSRLVGSNVEPIS